MEQKLPNDGAKKKKKPKKKKKVYKKPDNCISVEEARELHDNWKNTRHKHLNSCLQFEDKREFTWSVEELEAYLKYVKQESKKQGIKNPGIRIYNGAYSKGKCKMQRGYSTLFMVPTGSHAGESGKGISDMENNYKIAALNKGGSGHPPKEY